MALIDKDQLKAEIKRLHKAHSGKYGCDEVVLNLEYLEDFIDTLPEQPKPKPMNIPSGGGRMSTTPPKFKLDVKPEQPVEYPTSTEMIAEWENNELPLLRDKDFRGDAERMAYNAFMDGFAKGLGYKK